MLLLCQLQLLPDSFGTALFKIVLSFSVSRSYYWESQQCNYYHMKELLRVIWIQPLLECIFLYKYLSVHLFYALYFLSSCFSLFAVVICYFINLSQPKSFQKILWAKYQGKTVRKELNFENSCLLYQVNSLESILENKLDLCDTSWLKHMKDAMWSKKVLDMLSVLSGQFLWTWQLGKTAGRLKLEYVG